ncbi:MAG: hypothetical protein ACE5G7_01920 [Candidatus Hydrothermarchaeaceae archaeon]
MGIIDKLLGELRLRRFFLLEVLAIVAGIIGGLGGVFFREIIAFNQRLFFDRILPSLSEFIPHGGLNPAYILLPALGGLIVGPIIYTFASETKGHGVPEVMEASYLKGGQDQGEGGRSQDLCILHNHRLG